jgi:aspartate carbamoyltransferase catalytic subunit
MAAEPMKKKKTRKIKRIKPASSRHLLSMKTLNSADIAAILKRADYFLKNFVQKNRVCTTLKGKVIANLFFEPSTRTCNSFEIAAKRLGAIVLTPQLQTSSILKGESLIDTVQTFAAMGVSAFVIRHPENQVCEMLAAEIPTATFFNAGDGTNQHPSQALIDLFTIQQHKKNWSKLRVSMIGDILHSRVAHSLTEGLLTMNAAEIRLIGPANLLPAKSSHARVKIFHSLKQGLPDSDVILTLRIQKERLQQTIDFASFHQQFGLTAATLALAKNDAIVMHPGPMNRNIEIDSTVADGPQSVILQQVRNGVAIRMAILDLFCATHRL